MRVAGWNPIGPEGTPRKLLDCAKPLIRLAASGVVFVVVLGYAVVPTSLTAQTSCVSAPGWVCLTGFSMAQEDKRCGTGPCEECYQFVNRTCVNGESVAEDYWPVA